MNASIGDGALPEIAYYYPNATWRYGSTDFIKNLVLFFDGVGLLVPTYMLDKPFVEDPALATGLMDAGMLHLITPEHVIDKKIAERLAETLTDILANGTLDSLGRESVEFHELSYSRLGSFGDAGLAEMLFQEFEKRGLAKPSKDGVSIPMHPVARWIVLVLLAQLLKVNSRRLGMNLCPITDRPEVLTKLSEILDTCGFPTAGQVVAFDVQTVGVDLGAVPIDEVLSFRKSHGREYARDTREFARSLSMMPLDSRREAFEDRQAELTERAHDLARSSSSAWKKQASLVMSLAGAACALAGGDTMGALFSAGGAFAGYEGSGGSAAGAYSYLLKARHVQ